MSVIQPPADPAIAAIYNELAAIELVDPHTHIDPHAAASDTLADVLGYHYYTELAHSAGMPKSDIEGDGIDSPELVRRLIERLHHIDNTAQSSWLLAICQKFFGYTDDAIEPLRWREIYDAAESRMSGAQWADTVLRESNVRSVFLTNDFDDELSGFDTDKYIPCLRTDDLVFHLAKPDVRQRLAASTGIELDGSLDTLRRSLESRFKHFVNSGARACAISLPPDFSPSPVGDGRGKTALDHVLRHGTAADRSHRDALGRRVFWTLAELCDQYGLPFDLMIGVNRGVYESGVHQGRDLYDSRVSLIQYRELFNRFPEVRFPVSVLASVTNQELVSYAWIFPNVITNGHWWYSNTPSWITRDAAARIEAVPRNKQIGYYSDAYKLEFVWPKFDMYRRILARVLREDFVVARGWTETRAVELGRQILRGNVDDIFTKPDSPASFETVVEDGRIDHDAATSMDFAAVGGVAGVAGAAGMVAAGSLDDSLVADDAADVGDMLELEETLGADFQTPDPNWDAPTIVEPPSPDYGSNDASKFGDGSASSGDTIGSDQPAGSNDDSLGMPDPDADLLGASPPIDLGEPIDLVSSGDSSETVLEVVGNADDLGDLGIGWESPSGSNSNPNDGLISDESDLSLGVFGSAETEPSTVIRDQTISFSDPDSDSTSSSADDTLAPLDGASDASQNILSMNDSDLPELNLVSDPSQLGDASDTTEADTSDANASADDGLDDDGLRDDGLRDDGLGDLDPLPTELELGGDDMPDLQFTPRRSVPGDDLDLSDLEPLAFDEDSSGEDSSGEDSESKIRPLTGDQGFAPDEESLRLKPDPTTGEWTLPTDDPSPKSD